MSCFLLITLLQATIQFCGSDAVLAEIVPAASPESFSKQYTDVTKRILSAGVDLERFSLKFRMENSKQPKFRQLRYFLTQEAGAGCGLAFEITADKQFDKLRNLQLNLDGQALRNVLPVLSATDAVRSGLLIQGQQSGKSLAPVLHGAVAANVSQRVSARLDAARERVSEIKESGQALQRGLATAMTGSIIAGSGSCLELGSNALQAWKNKRHGYDHRSANAFAITKLQQIDQLLAEREALVSANPDNPGHERAVVEGKILHEMRNCFINEYSHFDADTRSFTAFQNAFFLLNACYNAVGAAGAGVAYKAVNKPKLNGPANILFVVSGGMAMLSPILSSAVSKLVRAQAYESFEKQLPEKPQFDATAFAALNKKLEDLAPVSDGTMIPGLPATQRLAMYTQSDELFRKQLDSETRTMRNLDQVALQTSVLGPVIGGQLMTQGILGTVGYYKYTTQPIKQVNQYYYGAVVGTVGTSMAVVGNAAWLLSSLSYQHHLSKEKKLPDQLIKSRLEHLDELEKTVAAL